MFEQGNVDLMIRVWDNKVSPVASNIHLVMDTKRFCVGKGDRRERDGQQRN